MIKLNNVSPKMLPENNLKQQVDKELMSRFPTSTG